MKWMATDEGVLGRSLGLFFSRDGDGRLHRRLAEKLYTIHRYESEHGGDEHGLPRSHLSDLIGFVYPGMPAADAARHLIENIKECRATAFWKRAEMPSFRSFWMARMRGNITRSRAASSCAASTTRCSARAGMEAVTVSEAIARHKTSATLTILVPGSWINANFNVWIGAPEDNRAWDYLYHARNFYEQNEAGASETQRKLAFEELLIAEGSDWNWWYGPEHHSANERGVRRALPQASVERVPGAGRDSA